MKSIRFLLFLMLILTLTLAVTSCDVSDLIEASLPREVESQIDNSFDKLEDRIEKDNRALRSAPSERLNRTETAASTEQSEPPNEETRGDKPNRKTDKDFVGEVALTYEDAERIALEHAGIASEEVLYLRTELDRDDGIPGYEVEFCVSCADGSGYMEYEYTIHADTGAILEFESDFEARR